MKTFTDNFHKVPRGLYKIYWKTKEPTLAALGEFSDGSKWMIECDNIFAYGTILGRIADCMHEIVKMELIEEVEEFDLEAFNKKN